MILIESDIINVLDCFFKFYFKLVPKVIRKHHKGTYAFC